MSIFEIRKVAEDNKDADAFMETLHDDFEFISHIDGTTMGRAQAVEMFTFLLSSDDFVTHESRCLYENDDVMIDHGVMSFPDGTRESVLAFHLKKDGKVIRMETGATVLP